MLTTLQIGKRVVLTTGGGAWEINMESKERDRERKRESIQWLKRKECPVSEGQRNRTSGNDGDHVLPRGEANAWWCTWSHACSPRDCLNSLRVLLFFSLSYIYIYILKFLLWFLAPLQLSFNNGPLCIYTHTHIQIYKPINICDLVNQREEKKTRQNKIEFILATTKQECDRFQVEN